MCQDEKVCFGASGNGNEFKNVSFSRIIKRQMMGCCSSGGCKIFGCSNDEK